MRHWSQLAIRNWRASWARTLGAVLAIALGTASVVWVTCCYESVRQTLGTWAATKYVGNAHITVSSAIGKYDQIPQRIVRRLRDMDGIEAVAPRLLQRLRAAPWPAAWKDRDDIKPVRYGPGTPQVDLHGLDLANEFKIRTYDIVRGRMLEPDDQYRCVLESSAAEEAELEIGDYLLVWTETQEKPFEIEIIGTFERRRIARFQKPVALMNLTALQRMRAKFALITTADVVLTADAIGDDEEQAVKKAASRIRRTARQVAGNVTVRTAEGRMKQIRAAESQQQFVVLLLSCVAMLTALFIILTTLSMGLVERISQLGLMRCVGVTRWQLAWLLVLEVMPIGLLGVALGIPIGLAFTLLTVAVAPQYVGSFAVSWRGLALGALAGLLTTALAALLPATAAFRVSPLEASRPRARVASRGGLLIAAGLALLLLAGQHFGLLPMVRRSLEFAEYAAGSIIALYVAYALLAPLAVWLIGSAAVHLVARLLGLRVRLLQDQVGHAVWRAAGVCCGVMVGLSLIIAVNVVNSSVTRGWQFPKEFPEAYLWSFSQFTPKAGELIAEIDGIRAYTVANSLNVIVEERGGFAEDLLMSVTWFMGCDPDSFLELVKLDFIEGEAADAVAKLKQGNHVIIADDFMRSRDKHLGDTVKIWDKGAARPHLFTVAGVVRSPSIDIAAGFFQMHSEYSVVASGSVLGTNEDVRRIFNVNGTKLVLLNFDLPETAIPENWPPPADSPEGRILRRSVYDERVPLERRWQRQKEQDILDEIRARIGAPQVFAGTVRELKDTIDAELSGLTRLFSAIPGIALLVAAVGVANLMMANVFARSRQLAIMRAVGATRGLVLRLVIGEALVLGLLGSGLGLALGIHLAGNITLLVERMWGFRVAVAMPWPLIGFSVAVTILLCLLAGIIPARWASRTNVVEALHVP